jgi:hypothetical protein
MLNEFYKKVLASLGLFVTEDNFIKTSGEPTGILVTEDGKPLVLPTHDHINTIFSKDDDGELIITKIPYNPLNENVIKGDTLSLKRTKTVAEVRLSYALLSAGALLLSLASNKELQKKTSIEINEFLASLNKAANPGIKKFVDDRSIELWQNMFAASLKSDKGFVTIFLKKSGVKDGVKYNRLATMACNLYDELLTVDNETPIYGVKLRNKDITIFKLMLEYLIPGIENGTISYGSNDSESPGFLSLFTLYKDTAAKIMSVIKQLDYVNKEYSDTGFIDITVTDQELNNLGVYKSELLTIPNEIDLTRQKAAKKIPLADINSVMTRSVGHLPVVQQQDNTLYQQPVQQPVYQQPVQPTMYQPVQQQFDEDPIKKILYGNGSFGGVPVQHVITKNEMGQYNANPNMMVNNYQQPVNLGISSMVNSQPNNYMYQQPQQPIYPQQMYQQPVYPQPMQMQPINPNGYGYR